MRWHAILFTICIILPRITHAAVPVLDESAAGFWDGKAVVVALVKAVDDPRKPIRAAELELIAVVFTDATIPVRLTIELRGAVANSAPAKVNFREGDTAFFLIERKVDGTWQVPNALLTVFESRCGIQLTDAKMTSDKFKETVARVEKARRDSYAKQSKAQHTAPK